MAAGFAAPAGWRAYKPPVFDLAGLNMFIRPLRLRRWSYTRPLRLCRWSYTVSRPLRQSRWSYNRPLRLRRWSPPVFCQFFGSFFVYGRTKLSRIFFGRFLFSPSDRLFKPPFFSQTNTNPKNTPKNLIHTLSFRINF